MLTGDTNSSSEYNAFKILIDKWRSLLAHLNRFVRDLNLDMATQANKEDKCTGHFWEGRFKNEQELTAEMFHIALNPIRAGIPKTP